MAVPVAARESCEDMAMLRRVDNGGGTEVLSCHCQHALTIKRWVPWVLAFLFLLR